MYGRPALALSLGLLAFFSTLGQAASVCNGHVELCSRLYSNVTFLGAHDSYAVGQSIADNQDKDVTAQLNDGIRTLQFQAHNATDGIHLCHSSCSLVDAGLMSDYLQKVATWVQANPTEVITLVMVNINTLPVSDFASAFEAAGLSNHVYSPSSATTSLSNWPTLGSLVDSGKTVVAFMDYNADFSSVPYIIDEFSNMWEDAYDVTTTTWECAVNRTSGNSGSMMMLINHFLDTTYNFGSTQFFVPDKSQINVTNSGSSLGLHVGNCNSVWGRAPNHILLDFYDSNGDEPFDFVAQLNGVSAPTNTVTPYAATATGATATTGSGSQASVSSKSTGAALARFSLIESSWVVGLSAGLVVFAAL